MTHSPARIIAALLSEDSAAPFTLPSDGLTWPVYTSTLPDEQDNCAAVFDTAGVLLARTVEGAFWNFAAQVRVRALSYAVGWSKIWAAHDLLIASASLGVVIDASTYQVQMVQAGSAPFAMGVENDNGRRRENFVFNVLATVKET